MCVRLFSEWEIVVDFEGIEWRRLTLLADHLLQLGLIDGPDLFTQVVDEFEDGDGLLGCPVGRDREWDGVLETGGMRVLCRMGRGDLGAGSWAFPPLGFLGLAIIFLLGVAWRAVRFVRGLP